MGSITLNKPSGGQLTLSPEDGATNETVTIPSVGVGKVLQVATKTFSTTSVATTVVAPTMAITGYFLDYYPLYTGSKIVIQATANVQKTGGGGSVVDLRRNGVLLNGEESEGSAGYGYIDYNGSATNIHNTVTMVAHDVAQSSSIHRYEIYFGMYQGTATSIRDWGAVTFTVWEVAQ